MGTGIAHLGCPATTVTFESIEKLKAEQILAAFGIEVNDQGKCLCFLHADTAPSMQVNSNWVYCYGCQEHRDNFGIAKALLSKQQGKEVSVKAVFQWFRDTNLPPASDKKYTRAQYIGEVDLERVEYWQMFMTKEREQQLLAERLLVPETIHKHRLGWRPDWKAWAIPFMRPDGKVDIVQFRLTEDTKNKYMGLRGHNRGSVMNADLLEYEQPYLIMLFGAFDAILARQDGLLAVGLNGSMPFRKTEKARVQKMFSKQKHIIIVPDNTPQEYTAAYKLAEWLDAEVAFFDTSLPDGTDYIDYRKQGHTAQEFMETVIGMAPYQEIETDLVEDIVTLIQTGDPFQLLPYHIHLRAQGIVARDLAVQVARHPLLLTHANKLWQVRDQTSLELALAWVANSFRYAEGGW